MRLEVVSLVSPEEEVKLGRTDAVRTSEGDAEALSRLALARIGRGEVELEEAIAASVLASSLSSANCLELDWSGFARGELKIHTPIGKTVSGDSEGASVSGGVDDGSAA